VIVSPTLRDIISHITSIRFPELIYLFHFEGLETVRAGITAFGVSRVEVRAGIEEPAMSLVLLADAKCPPPAEVVRERVLP